ncbi:MAG: V-type ATP synthase subunit E [Nanoarchaeota archaeon]
MGFEQLKKDIMGRAEKEAQLMIKEAHKEAEDEKRKVELEFDNREQKAIEDAKNTIRLMEKRELASAKLEAKKKKLIEKKKIIENTFEKAKLSINSKLKKSERKEIIEKILKKAEAEITIGKIYCNKTDAELINRKDVEYKDIIGGIIAEDKTGNVVVDYSFETLLEQVKENHMADVTKILFE